MLNSYFAPIDFNSIIILVFVLFTFDSIGSFIAGFIKPAEYLRPIYWIWGMALIAFFLFLMHLALPFRPEYITILLLSSLSITLPSYLKRKDFTKLYVCFKNFKFPFLILILIAQPLFFLLSAPPYYADEMLYHFYSPARILLEQKWPFLDSFAGPAPSLYEMIPKSLDIIYWMTFSLSKTYVLARILHFILAFSVLFAVSLFLKRNLNRLSAIIFISLALLLSTGFLHSTTIGYVDAAAGSLAILFLIMMIDLVKHPKKSQILASTLVLSSTLGIKYSSIAFSLTVACVSLILILLSVSKLRSKIAKSIKLIPKLILIFTFFGGFWYIRNFVLSGNPVYPIALSCWHGWLCPYGANLFGATPFDREHVIFIIYSIFQERNLVFATAIALIISIIYSFRQKTGIIKNLSVIIILSLFFELILIKRHANFELRYYYHWFLLIPLVLALPAGLIERKKSPYYYFLIFLIYLIPINMVYMNVQKMYQNSFTPKNIKDYALRKISLNGWLESTFPKMNQVIKWCGDNKSLQNLILIDPYHIWFSSEAGIRAYLLNCNIQVPFSSTSSNDDLVKMIRKQYPNGYLISEERCGHFVKKIPQYADNTYIKRHDLNQKLICSSKEILSNLYIISNK